MSDDLIRIRKAAFADATAIASVQVQTWQSAYRGIIDDAFLDRLSIGERTDRWQQILQQSAQQSFIATAVEQSVIGFATCGCAKSAGDRQQGELHALYVLPEWHSKGIGKRLVIATAEWLRDTGYCSMVVWTLAENPYRGFYTQMGGRLIDEKIIDIGEQRLIEVAYQWISLDCVIGRGIN